MQRFDDLDIAALQACAAALIGLGLIALLLIVRDLLRDYRRKNRRVLPPPSTHCNRDYRRQRYIR